MLITTEFTGIAGLQGNVTDGAHVRPGYSQRGAAIFAPYLREAVLRGKAFAVANQAGVTSQAGLSATTPVLTLYNPAGSGVNGILHYAGAAMAVVNAAAAAVMLAANTALTAAAVTGTLTTTHRNLKLGGAEPTLRPFLAATLPAAPVGICLLGMGLTGAITTVPGLTPFGRWFDGSLVITPGSAISIQTSTASGANGLWCEYVWEEEVAN
jgi:hypothetical protein